MKQLKDPPPHLHPRVHLRARRGRRDPRGRARRPARRVAREPDGMRRDHPGDEGKLKLRCRGFHGPLKPPAKLGRWATPVGVRVRTVSNRSSTGGRGTLGQAFLATRFLLRHFSFAIIISGPRIATDIKTPSSNRGAIQVRGQKLRVVPKLGLDRISPPGLSVESSRVC